MMNKLKKRVVINFTFLLFIFAVSVLPHCTKNNNGGSDSSSLNKLDFSLNLEPIVNRSDILSRSDIVNRSDVIIAYGDEFIGRSDAVSVGDTSYILIPTPTDPPASYYEVPDFSILAISTEAVAEANATTYGNEFRFEQNLADGYYAFALAVDSNSEIGALFKNEETEVIGTKLIVSRFLEGDISDLGNLKITMINIENEGAATVQDAETLEEITIPAKEEPSAALDAIFESSAEWLAASESGEGEIEGEEGESEGEADSDCVEENDLCNGQYVALEAPITTNSLDTVCLGKEICCAEIVVGNEVVYDLTESFLVRQGIKLKVCPGVVLHISSGMRIDVEGTLDLFGTSSENISLYKKDNDNWGGILVHGGGILSANYTYIAGVTVHMSGNAAIDTQDTDSGTTISVYNSTFENIDGNAINLRNNGIIANNLIVAPTGNGISASDATGLIRSIVIYNNTVNNAGQHGIYLNRETHNDVSVVTIKNNIIDGYCTNESSCEFIRGVYAGFIGWPEGNTLDISYNNFYRVGGMFNSPDDGPFDPPIDCTINGEQTGDDCNNIFVDPSLDGEYHPQNTQVQTSGVDGSEMGYFSTWDGNL